MNEEELEDFEDDKKTIEWLMQEQGHSYHCACRIVWGDGECECNEYEKGYDPYAWIKKI